MGGARPRGTLVVCTPEFGEERFTLPLAVARSLKKALDTHDINPGSRAELLYEMRERSYRCASDRVGRLIDKRDYSATEIDQKLSLDGYAPSVREAVVARALEVGLVDNRRYADSFIRSKVRSGWGMARISAELARHGIDAGTVPGWPDAFLADESEDERAYALAKTRRVSSKNGYQKLVRFLNAKGYSLSVACRAARRVIEESGASAPDAW